MNLIFRKNSDGQFEVLFRNGTAEDPFSYVEMIKYLLNGNELGSNEFGAGISEKEQESVNAMLEEINKVVKVSLDDDEPEQ